MKYPPNIISSLQRFRVAFVFIAAFTFVLTGFADDPIVGKWRWFSNEVKVFGPKGNAGGEGLHGHWKRVEGAIPPRYIITWGKDKFIDRVHLTGKGNDLEGKNTDGWTITAHRIPPGQ